MNPSESSHHLALARVLWRGEKWDQALSEARNAERLARMDQTRAEAQSTISRIEAARPH